MNPSVMRTADTMQVLISQYGAEEAWKRLGACRPRLGRYVLSAANVRPVPQPPEVMGPRECLRKALELLGIQEFHAPNARHKHWKEIIQWALGADTEYRKRGSWQPCSNPIWGGECEYRIANKQPIRFRVTDPFSGEQNTYTRRAAALNAAAALEADVQQEFPNIASFKLHIEEV